MTDFLRFYTEIPSLKSWLHSWNLPSEYPSFNVADMALVIGVILFVLHYMFLEDEAADKPKAAGGETPPPGPASTDPAS